MLPAFLAEAMCSSSVRDQVVASASGTSASMRKINKTKIRSYTVPAPPLEEQHRALRVIESVRQCLIAAQQQEERLKQLRSRLLGCVLDGSCELPETYDRFLTDAA